MSTNKPHEFTVDEALEWADLFANAEPNPSGDSLALKALADEVRRLRAVTMALESGPGVSGNSLAFKALANEVRQLRAATRALESGQSVITAFLQKEIDQLRLGVSAMNNMPSEN